MLQFEKGAEDNQCKYPITQDQIDNLKPCGLVNVKVGDSHGLEIPSDFDIEASTDEILEVRLMVSKGIFPLEFMEKYYPFAGELPAEIPAPLASEGLSFEDPEGLANVVHMDLPSQMPNACLRWIAGQGVNVKTRTPAYKNFLETIPYAQEQITDGVKAGLNKSFEAKYYFGLARPEEVLEARGNIEGKLMTAYPEGCPGHPSYPAGHGGAAGGGVLALINHFELTDDQIKVLLDSAYVWAMARSLAGVHHAIDNVAGVELSLKKYFV